LDDDSDEDGSEETSEDDADDSAGPGALGAGAPQKMPEGAYNADDYKHLKVGFFSLSYGLGCAVSLMPSFSFFRTVFACLCVPCLLSSCFFF
jgi:hypothetical protein